MFNTFHIFLTYYLINPFLINVSPLYPLKTSENPRFFMFSGGMEMEHWLKRVKMARNLSYLVNFDLQQLSAYSDFCSYHFNNDLPKLIQDYVKHL